MPNQYDLDSTVDVDLANQGTIERDLTDLADSGAFAKPLCGPIAVPNHRAVPRLAFNLDVKPTQIVSASEQAPAARGYFLDPASPFVIHNFILDPNDPTRFSLHRPPGFRRGRPQRVLAPLPSLLRLGLALAADRLGSARRSTRSTASWVAEARSGSASSIPGGSSTCRSLEGSRRARSVRSQREPSTWPPRLRSSPMKCRW